MRNPVEMARTIYPRLPDIPDEETLSAITIKGLDFIQAHLDPKSTTLPTAGVPIAFFSSEWMRRAIVRQRWSDQISLVHAAHRQAGNVEPVRTQYL